MKALEGKVAIVAGGARDIGRAVSEKLAAEGAKVVVNYFNNPAHGEETVSAIEANGGTAIAVAGDMTQKSDVDNLIKFVMDSMNEVLYPDDRQISSLHVTKLLDNDGLCEGSTEICLRAVSESDFDVLMDNSFKIVEP